VAASTVALTGATGFVGGAIARHLSAQGFELRLLARRPAALPALSGDHAIVRGALDERDKLDELLSGAEMVVHTAGLIKALDEREFMAVNRDGAAAVAESARKAGARRFVLISSIAARSPLLSSYAASKRAGEAAVIERLGSEASIIRPPVVYGPGDRETLPMFRAARLGYFPVPGPPEARLSFIHVADLAAAVAASLASPAAPAGIFEIDDGTAGGYGWPEIGDALGVAFGRTPRPVPLSAPLLRIAAGVALLFARMSGRPMMLRPDKVNELRHPDWVCRDSNFSQLTRWHGQFDLHAGFCDAVAWYRAQGMLK
jgi:2-alkyl-3-oxoalkanoate reductase